MKSVYYVIILICIIALFSSCMSDKGYTGGKLITGPAATDIVNYVNQGLISIRELEIKSFDRYESVAGENFTSNQKLIETLKDFIIPTYNRFLTGLKKINPENPEIQPVHAIYIRAAESTLTGFNTILNGCENNDVTIIKQGNKKLEEGRTGVDKWRVKLDELYMKHGVAEKKEN